jgi:hypothetical protein
VLEGPLHIVGVPDRLIKSQRPYPNNESGMMIVDWGF